jgi:hypothetical protein
MASHSQARKILGLAAALAVGFGLLAPVTPWHAELAESNFQANRIRLESFLFNPTPKTVLVGTSLTGRLRPSYLSDTGLAPVANLGLDGLDPMFGLDFVLSRPTTPPLVVIEANMLTQSYDSNEATLKSAVEGIQFRLARYVPLLRAQFRPSSMFYSWLKDHQGGQAGAPAAVPAASDATNPAVAAIPAVSNQAGSDATKERVRCQVRSLRERGARIVLLRMPMNGGAEAGKNPSFAFADELAREFQLSQVDLEAELAARGLAICYTDGLHLAAGSARDASRVLAEVLEREKNATP